MTNFGQKGTIATQREQMFYRVVGMRYELARYGRHMAIKAAAAIYYLLFRLARRIAVEPPPVIEPDPPVMPDPVTFLMAVEAARRTNWPG
jgi:hypothetical protein